ncbi:hypothetical protein [Bradyrhizobium shewense]|nr:hypothetical protein [Bradyrhizobium shewense]
MKSVVPLAVAEAIPIVVDADAGLIGVDEYGNPLAALVSRYDQVIGV